MAKEQYKARQKTNDIKPGKAILFVLAHFQQKDTSMCFGWLEENSKMTKSEKNIKTYYRYVMQFFLTSAKEVMSLLGIVCLVAT